MNIKKTFSMSEIWINSLYLRYPYNRIKKIGDLYFYEENDILKCQHFFNIKKCDFELLKKEIKNNKKIRFSYLNESNFINDLKVWTQKNNFVFEIIDSWNAPLLKINSNICNYLENNKSSQIKRNYKKYLRNKNNYLFKNSKDFNILELWKAVLNIDFNSWKKEEISDMKSLNREDLQYLPFLLENKKNSNLVVVYENNIPLAYSLMFKDYTGWYAVKWGASYKGRKKIAGFYALFNHLEYLYNTDKKINLDFWGRRNNTYDLLKNKSILRYHILIYKKEE